MKKSRLLIVLAGLSVFASGCGFSTGGEDSTVTVIHATPTPTPSPTPEVTPTPEATPTPAPVVSPTALGVNIVKQDATYYATTDVNLRQDCSTDNAQAPVLQGVPAGTQLTSTGVSEDKQWIEVNYNGTVCYASMQYVTTTAPAGAATDAAAAQTDTAAAQ
ncbi:MAG TPA: SH3 domain-containing protein [Candidatus Blautia faecipullorum]|nr:SH3 domain-containing protein [Candidatus Blautia faecipullorum]